FSTISWEMRTTALRISSEVMIRRPFTTLPPGLTGPHRRLAGRARRSWPSVASTLAQDQDVRRGLRLDLAERVATPAEHLERALLAVLAGRADPGQPVLADREAPQRRLARQRLVLADRAGRRVDDHEVQASVGRLGVLAHPDREADAVGIELGDEVLDVAGDDRGRIAGGAGARRGRRRGRCRRGGVCRRALGEPAIEHELPLPQLPGDAIPRPEAP